MLEEVLCLRKWAIAEAIISFFALPRPVYLSKYQLRIKWIAFPIFSSHVRASTKISRASCLQYSQFRLSPYQQSKEEYLPLPQQSNAIFLFLSLTTIELLAFHESDRTSDTCSQFLFCTFLALCLKG